jgi:hypothetical protein
MDRTRNARCLAALVALVGSAVAGAAVPQELRADVRAWRLIPRESGPVNYYRVVEDPAQPYIRATYEPGEKTAVLGFEVPSAQSGVLHHLAWSWRALVLPRGGDECAHGAEDSAAVVYVTWKRGLRWYTLKYVWSAVGAKGATCDRKRNLFVAQDTIVLETGGPVGVWAREQVDLETDFHAHFGAGALPALQGLGLMTDGDQTQSPSSADYAAFVLSP